MFNPVTTHTKIHTVFMLQNVRKVVCIYGAKEDRSWNFSGI